MQRRAEIKKGFCIFAKTFLSGKQDLNLRPQRPERRALPAALLPVINKIKRLVLVAGCDFRVPNLKMEEPLRKIAKNLEQFFRFDLQATHC